MYKRLKHLIINVDAFREKMRIGYYPQIGRKERKVAREMENNQGAFRLWKIEDMIVGRATDVQEHQEAILRSCSAIGNQKDFDFGLLDLDACVGFCFVFHLWLTTWINGSLVIIV